METWRAGDTSVERLSWSSAWMARVEGWWIEGVDDGGNELEWETDFMPLGGVEGGMLVIWMFYETGLQYSLDVQMERLAEELPGRVHGLAIAILQQYRISTELSMKLYIIPGCLSHSFCLSFSMKNIPTLLKVIASNVVSRRRTCPSSST